MFPIGQGLYGKGKSGEKGSFSLRSEKVRETCNGQGKSSIFMLQVRGRISFFIIKEVFRFFSLYSLFIPLFYLDL